MRWEKDFVRQAMTQKQIIIGFNVFGYEDAQAVIRAAERADSPVLLMINRDARKVLSLVHWAALLGSLAHTAAVPVGVHLDHCNDLAVVRQAIDLGLDSVMYDGSKLPLEENIRNTAQVCKWAHAAGIRVEAELGTVPYDELGETESRPTSPQEVAQLCAQTEVDWLAVSVGNVHRLLKRKVHIDFAALHAIEAVCPVPLVIHGASGLEESDTQTLMGTHVGKVNVGTALRRVFGETLRAGIEQNPNVYDRLALFEEPTARIEDTAYQIIQRHREASYHGRKQT